MAQNADDLIPTRASLLHRLKDWQDHSSWQDFFDTYSKLIHNVALKAGLSEAEAKDVVQETVIAVAKHMPTFKYDPNIGTFKSWLLTMTRWRITDQLRKRENLAIHQQMEDPSTGTSIMDKVADPLGSSLEAVWNAEWEKTLLESALAKVKRRLDPQKYQIFDLYVNKNWPPEKVAKTFGVSVGLVYSAKNRVTEMIAEEVKKLEIQFELKGQDSAAKANRI
ncbi:MAG: sigma-70 family RNA polymerase sigma factor [Limisphaerales bacterium]